MPVSLESRGTAAGRTAITVDNLSKQYRLGELHRIDSLGEALVNLVKFRRKKPDTLWALKNATLPFVLDLASKGYRQALLDDAGLLAGLNINAGKVTYRAVAAGECGIEPVSVTEGREEDHRVIGLDER